MSAVSASTTCGTLRLVVSAQSLRERWRGTAQPLAREVTARLVEGRSLHDLDLAAVDGRVDLRGLWVVSSRGLPGLADHDRLSTTPTAARVVWRDLDLSHSTLRIDLLDAEVHNVRLNRVGWQDWRATATIFTDCSFQGADLRGACFDGYNSGLESRSGPNPISTYRRCDFTRTRIGPYGGFGRARLEDCVFAETRLPSPMWFAGAHIERCRFVGRFRTVCFGWTGVVAGTAPWLDADVSEAEFESLEVYAHSGPGAIQS